MSNLCRVCRYDVGCDCNLTKGMCFTCYSRFQANVQEKGTTEEEELIHECKKLSELEELRKIMIAKEKRNQLIDYQIVILNSQIRQYYKNPCEYKEIIEGINAN